MCVDFIKDYKMIGMFLPGFDSFFYKMCSVLYFDIILFEINIF